MLKYIPTHRQAAKDAAVTNNKQKELIADVSSIITCMIVLFDKEIGSTSTKKYVDSCMIGNDGQGGYNKYNRLTDSQLAVMKNIILQHSSEILAALDEQNNKESSDVEKPTTRTIGGDEDGEVDGHEDGVTGLDDGVDPF